MAKLSPTGTWLWATQGGGTYDDEAQAIAVDARGNVYTASDASSINAAFGSVVVANPTPNPGQDIFVAKPNTAGQW